MLGEPRSAGLPVGEAQGSREPQVLHVPGGQPMGLALLHHLKVILYPAEKQIGLLQGFCVGRRHQPLPVELAQCPKRSSFTQRGFLPSVQQLQGVDEEFDFPNPSRSELHVLRAGLRPNVDLSLSFLRASTTDRSKLRGQTKGVSYWISRLARS